MEDLRKVIDINISSEKFYKNNSYTNKWRLNYHLEPPFGLLNDPNGLAYYNGEYYIFYQWNPYKCEHKDKHWALVKTKDFIHYSIPKAVLAPDDWYDKDGCYSGSAIVIEDKLELFYTGNVRDNNGNRESYQCRATIDKNGNLVKKGPVVDKLPEGYTAHFRDPSIFKRNGKYYFIVGAQLEKLLGRALLYSSKDLKEWKFEGEINTDYKDFGFMWECPSLFNLEGKDILVFSPQGLESEEYKYQNIYQSGYIVGKFNFETLNFEHGEFRELDLGKDFYAPQVFKDKQNRTILIGWMGLPEEEDNYATKELGWVHCLTMPRELILKDDTIYQVPLKEFENYRTELLEDDKNVICREWKTDKLKDNSYELLLDIDNLESNRLELRFLEGKDEYSSLVFDCEKGIGFLDNNKLINGVKSIRKFKFNENKIKIHMFVDKSAVEIFLQDGKTVLSSRVYPEEASTGLRILSENNINIRELKLWSLGEMVYEE